MGDRSDKEAGSYAEIEAEVGRNFGGNWENFLKAVANPAEILLFVLRVKCKMDTERMEAWSVKKNLPKDWLQRFYMTLNEDGSMKTPEELGKIFAPQKEGDADAPAETVAGPDSPGDDG